MTLAELRAHIDDLVEERNQIIAASETRFADPEDATEVRSLYVLGEDGEPTDELDQHAGLTDDEATRMDEIDAELVQAEVRAKRLEVAEAAGRRAPAPKADSVRGSFNINMNNDPGDLNILTNGSPVEIRSAAIATIEDDVRAADFVKQGIIDSVAATEARSMHGLAVARHVVATSSDDYRSGFRKVLVGAQLDVDELRAFQAADEQRASLALGSGYTLPVTVDPTFLRTGDLENNPLRMVATVEQSSTNVTHINTMGGVTASYDAEGAEVSDDTPTPGTVSITCVKPQAYVEYSYESGQDIGNLESELLGLLSEAKGNLEAVGHMTGSGTGNNPQGLLVGLVAGSATVNCSTSTALVEADIYAVRNALQRRHRANASWLMDQTVMDIVRQMETGGGHRISALWLPDGDGDRILNRQAYEASAMPDASGTTLSAGDEVVVYGNIAQCFRIIDRVGATVETIPVVMGANQRPTGKRGLYMHWRNGSGVVNASAARALEAIA